MPQETNLNVSPYYDDFNEDKNFYKILFKPSYPVQARELTGLQSILQNQIENFGNHFFKEGSVVIPGQLSYIKNFNCVEINSFFGGVPVSSYLDTLTGTTIKGRTSGVTAKIVKVISSEESERGNITLYIDYIESSIDSSQGKFFDNEVLEATKPLEIATNVFINPGEGFASTLSENSISTGSAFGLSDGVYFLRGYFVKVNKDILILDQYTNSPSYRVGFLIEESIVNYYEDSSLTDNARGFNNFAAPGADRLKISATLTKKDIDDFEDKNFVLLATIENGVLRDIKNKTEYSFIADELARRTFDESGDYYVKSFNVILKDSLNNGFNNGGIHSPEEKTQSGSIPSEELALYKVSPGKAYVKGYEVETISPVFLDVLKPRTFKKIDSHAINFDFGPQFQVNRVYGNPFVGFNTTSTVSLRDSRIGSTHAAAAGNEIGIARAYDFYLENGSYTASNLNANIWNLSLFDVQTYSKATLNNNVTLNTPIYIRGQQSGATGYLQSNVSNSNQITIYQINGEFSEKEVLIFEGNIEGDQSKRYITSLINYGISDIKSIYSNPIGSIVFNCDTVQEEKTRIGSATISAKVGSNSVVTVTENISNKVSVGDIVSYSTPGISTVTYVKVTSVDAVAKEIGVTEIFGVSGVNYGLLPASQLVVSDFSVLETKLSKTEYTGNPADNDSLFSILPKLNIQSIDLSQSQITVRKEFPVSITSNSTNIISADVNELFLPFDEERYTLVRSNGQVEVLTEDKFTFIDGSTKIRIDNLGSNDSGCRLICTLRKVNVTSKTKNKKLVESLILDKSNNRSSGTGNNTLNDGLTYGNYPYGTRVQDSDICLNYPDINLLYGIFESKNENNPDSPVASLSSLTGATGTTNDLIIGEYFQGRFSKAKGIYVERKNDTSIGFIYLNENVFSPDEIIDFELSQISANIGSIVEISDNVTKKYSLKNGQKKSYYDYSKLTLNSSSNPSSRKLKVYFMRGFYDTSDTGDITTKESYNSFNYGTEIQTINGVRVTDIIDLRPRVSDYYVVPGARSPFEFYARNFSSETHSSKYIISGSDPLTLGYSYYLPRYDRIYLSKNGTFSIKSGVPSDDPKLPEEVSGSMNIANIYLPPYLYSTKDALIEFISHRRYQMSDIGLIEDRVAKLEKFTTLTALETKTENFFVDDGTGLNRFKSGFFVDNFSSLLTQFTIGIKNSIDPSSGILRPPHYTTDIKLEIGNDALTDDVYILPIDRRTDYRYANIIGSNIKRTGDIITLDYTETSWLRQPFATRSENVTPYLVTVYEGSIELNPTVDVWIDTRVIEPNNVVMEGSYRGVAESLQVEVSDSNDALRVGVSPVIWKSWETTGIDVNVRTETLSSSSTSSFSNTGNRQGTAAEFTAMTGLSAANGVPSTFRVGTEESGTTTTTVTTTNEYLNVALDQQRTGTQYTVTEEINTESLGERIVSRDIINYMRSRNIEFTARRMRPFTRVYPFFDGVNVSDFCFNKLVKIEMISGSFNSGEIIYGYSMTDVDKRVSSVFRLAVPNHKYGPYNDPTDVFDRDPYDRDNTIPSEYTTTSTILNIDTYSLSEEVDSGFYGDLKVGMIVYGNSSGAQARVLSVDLITDRVGTLIGSYKVPDITAAGSPQFETGRSRFRLTSSPTNSQVPGVITTYAEESFYSQGDADVSQSTTLSLRNARVDVDTSFVETRSLSDEALIDSTTTVSTSTNSNTRLTGEYTDPLAQSFIVDDETGIFVTKVDLYFRTKDESLPVTVQIREVELGTPTQKILAFSEVELLPDQVNLSDDASIPTSFTFSSPVYLEGQREYAIIILSTSNEYNLWISRLGEPDIATLSNEQNQILVTTQRLLGSLFKSQNASTWTPSQYEDLTFNLFRADFVSSGYTQFFNQNLPESLSVMKENPLIIESNRIKISISSTITSAIDFGTKIIQEPSGFSTASGTLVGYGGSATGALQIINSGIGYTPSSGSFTYTNVPLKNLNGSGIGAEATIVIQNGSANSATITNGGSGYSVGDTLEPVTIGSNNLGTGMILSVSDLLGSNQIILENVQGEFKESGTDVVKYLNGSGQIVDLNGGSTYINAPVQIITDGLHAKVFHRNHGMYSSNNNVSLKGIETDLNPVSLTSDYSSSTTNDLPVSNTTIFQTFENLQVSALNPGYVIINEEIIKYTGYTNTSLTGIERGIDNTIPLTHLNGNLVRKYELGGISLRRINKTHSLLDVSESIENKIGIHHYYIKIDTELRTDLKFNSTKEVGGTSATASYNIPFNAVNPNFKSITPTGSSIKYEMNTITGTTLGGSEISFVDSGLQDIENNSLNFFDSTRLVASPVNQIEWLGDVPFNKSISVNVYFRSLDSRISPAIDLNRTDLILISNTIGDPKVNYIEDYRVNTIFEDPHLFAYVTNPINLETPSSSLKVILDAYINLNCDIRVFYSTGDNDIFVPFPGYSNLNSDGSIIDFSQNDGKSDKFIHKNDHNLFNPSISEYNEYEYTIDNLSSFKTFKIKIVGTSTNSSFVPMIRNLRVIALGAV